MQGGKGKAHLAIIADEGLSIPAGHESAAAFIVRPKSAAAKPLAARSAAAVHEPRDMVMEGSDKKFCMGQHRNEIYSELAKKVEFLNWLMAQALCDLSMQNQDFPTWFNKYYTTQDGSVHVRSSVGLPEGAYVPRPRKTGIRKTPPNPPLAQTCTLCRDFTHAGSTMNFIRSTCRDCGHVEQKPREVTYTHDPQCGTVIGEVQEEFRAATSNALDVINAMTNKEAVTYYSPEAVEAILSVFNDRVLQVMHDEERVDDIILHDHLREAIVKTMEDPDSPWSEVTTRGTSPTPVAMMVYDTTGMPYS